MDDEVRRLSGQAGVVDDEIVKAEEAVARASERTRQANAEFSSLMSAMSVAFREYDQAVRGGKGTRERKGRSGKGKEKREREAERERGGMMVIERWQKHVCPPPRFLFSLTWIYL